MCDLLGLCSDKAGKATPLLESLAGHSVRNPDGWGIAYYRGREAIVLKQAEPARPSAAYSRAAGEAESRIILSHIRKASCGVQHERNCHPFLQELYGRQWAFAHNGHIDGIGPHPRSRGETDSEAVFHLILDCLGQESDPFQGIAAGIRHVFEEYEFGREIRLNFLLSDGEALYAFNHHPEKTLYASGWRTEAGESVAIATQTLDGQRWAALPEDRLLAARDGKLVRMSGKL